MTSSDLWALVAISLVSGLVGSVLTTWFYAYRERRRFRVDTLKRFAATRFNLRSDVFMQVLNEIVVAFNDDRRVMAALRAFHEIVISGEAGARGDDALIALYKAMCRSAKIDVSGFNDSFFLRPFSPSQ